MCCNFGGARWSPEKTVKHATRPAIFKWRQTAPKLIRCSVRWYLRYSLSLRDVVELLARARSGGGSHDDLALGSTLRSRTGTTAASSSQADEQILACR